MKPVGNLLLRVNRAVLGGAYLKVTLEETIANLRGIVKDVGCLQGDLCWINRIDQARNWVHCALETLDRKPLALAVASLQHDLTFLDRINSRLTEAARGLQFEELVAALGELLRRISNLNLDRTKLTRFEDGIDAIDRLAFSLEVLIDARLLGDHRLSWRGGAARRGAHRFPAGASGVLGCRLSLRAYRRLPRARRGSVLRLAASDSR